MSRKNHPLYQEGVAAYLQGKMPLLRRIQKDAALSQAERTLLEVRACFREQKFERAKQLIDGISTQGFLKAERSFLMATALNHLGQFEKAIRSNLEALSQYEELDDRRGVFLALYNLSVDFGRMGLLDLSEHFIQRAEKFSEGAAELSLVYRAAACQASKMGDSTGASGALEKALSLRADLNDVDRGVLDTVCADIFFRLERWEDAQKAFDRLRLKRSNRENARVEFEYRALTFLRQGGGLGQPGSVIESSPEHFRKWRLLRAIQSGERSLARSVWGELKAENAEVYGKEFELLNPSDRKSVFGVALSRLLSVSAPLDEAAPLRLKSQGDGKLSKLFQILTESTTPIRKEELIEKIWDTAYDPKLDSRFYKLVQRLRNHSKIPIESRNRAYQMKRRVRMSEFA